MTNPLYVAGMVQGLAEGVHLGQSTGAGPGPGHHSGERAAQSGHMEQRGPSLTEGRFDFGFAVPRRRKDLAACVGSAWRNGPTLRLAARIDPFYPEIVVQGGARFDTSSLVQRRRRSAANS